MRIRYDDLSEVLWLDIYDTGQGEWVWTVNRAIDTYVITTQTPEQFLGDFLTQVNTKLETYCADSGGGELPDDFIGRLEYYIKNNLSYDSTSNTVTFN